MNGASTRAVWVATIAAATLIAGQVAGKALRDALFLANFDVTRLPGVVMGTALASLLAIFVASRLLSTLGPLRFVPIALIGSALLHVGEWLLYRSEPRLVSAIVYFHIACAGPVLLSGFWSAVSEGFDARTARLNLARIGGGGTLGGLAGGVLAGGIAYVQTEGTLLLLAGLSIASAVLVLRMPVPARRETTHEGGTSPLRAFAASRYLQLLAVLVVSSAFSAALLDYAFKARAAQAVLADSDLLRYFAAYHTVISLLTVVVQFSIGPLLLSQPRLAYTMATLPFTVALGGVFAAIFPRLGTAAFARGGESVMRNTLYRAAYEGLSNPIPVEERRAIKPMIDVGADRVGDALGAAAVQLAISLAPLAGPATERLGPLLWIAVAVSLAALALTSLLDREHGERIKAELARVSGPRGGETRADLFGTGMIAGLNESMYLSLASIDVRALRAAEASPAATERPSIAVDSPVDSAIAADPLLERIVALRSGSALKVRSTLSTLDAVTLDAATARIVAVHLVRLLARDDLKAHVTRTLERLGPRVSGSLIDALLDPDEEFTVRRRIPRLLGHWGGPIVVEGLLHALFDPRFEVRYAAGQALASIRRRHPLAVFERARVLSAVEREVEVDRSVWDSQRLLDHGEESEGSLVDPELARRATASLAHVFDLLSLVLDYAGVQRSFRALLTDDPALRGPALEFLERELPLSVRKGLWPYLDDRGTRAPTGRPTEQILDDLARAHPSIELRLRDLLGASGEDIIEHKPPPEV